MRKATMTAALLAALSLASCGSDPLTRGVTGGAIGAIGGAITAS